MKHCMYISRVSFNHHFLSGGSLYFTLCVAIVSFHGISETSPVIFRGYSNLRLAYFKPITQVREHIILIISCLLQGCWKTSELVWFFLCVCVWKLKVEWGSDARHCFLNNCGPKLTLLQTSASFYTSSFSIFTGEFS